MSELSSKDEVINFEFFNRESSVAKLDQVTVKFYTTDAKVYTRSFPKFLQIVSVVKTLAEMFGCGAEKIELLYKEEPISPTMLLEQFKPDRYGILEFKLTSTDRNYKIPIENAYKDLTVPDIITVRVQREKNEVDEVVVEIENKAIDKPFLGGYKDPQTGIQYHHGYTQTGPPKEKVPSDMKNHRDTQTHFIRNRKTDQEYSRATQVANCEIYIPNICDKIVEPGPYETADEREKRLDLEGKVKTIQRYFRAFRVKQRLQQMSDEYEKRVRLEMERDEKDKRDDDERRRKDLVSKVFPVKPGDFAMLYNMVERWKKSEIDRITSMACGGAKIADFYLLLEKEIEILQSIERLRCKVKQDLEVKKITEFFKAIGSPVEWDSDYKQIHIVMDTLEAQKGRECFDMYKRLVDKKNTKDDRLEVYVEIIEYLKKHHCTEGQEIIGLIERVCELQARGMSEGYLSGLRKRIEALMLHHFKLEACNGGVTNHMKRLKKENMTKNLIFCPSCQKLKPIEGFTIDAGAEKMKTCTTCKWLDKADEPWVDLAPHKFLLRQIRNYERLHHGKSSIAFILQDRDIHLIVNYIWHCHSALSECNDIYQLRLVRWKKEQEWSPWNCILLTLEEAKSHLKVNNLETVYEKEFTNHIFNKHALARRHFKHLTAYDQYFTKFAEGDQRMDEDSDYYNKKLHGCDLVYDTDSDEFEDMIANEKTNSQYSKQKIGRKNITIEDVDSFIEKRMKQAADYEFDRDDTINNY